MCLLKAYDDPPEPGRTVIDRIRDVVVTDADATAGVMRVMLRRVKPNQYGSWDMMTIVAAVYAVECQDDSLTILVRAAAAEQGVTLRDFEVSPRTAVPT